MLAWVHHHWWLTLGLVLAAVVLGLAVGGFASVVTSMSLEGRRSRDRRRRARAALRAVLRANLAVLRRIEGGLRVEPDDVALESALRVERGAIGPATWAAVERARAALLIFERAMQSRGTAGVGPGSGPVERGLPDEAKRAAALAEHACKLALAALEADEA